MNPEEIGMAFFGISLRDSDFAHIKSAQEMTDKTLAAVVSGIQMAIQAERERCLEALRKYDTGVLDYAAILAPVPDSAPANTPNTPENGETGQDRAI